MSFELFLTEPYFQKVLITTLLVAASAGALGFFLLQRGMSLFGDGIAHISFSGISIAFVAGFLPLPTALLVAIVGALLIQELQRRQIARSDAALGIVYTTALALGIVLVSSQGSVPPSIESYLFGNLLLSGTAEFQLALVVAIIVLGSVAVLWRPLTLLALDEAIAKTQGIPVRLLNTLFVILAAATVVASVRVVGVLLVTGLLILPASGVTRWTRSVKQSLIASVFMSQVAVLVGLFVSATFGLASGATITIAAAGLLLLQQLVPKRS